MVEIERRFDPRDIAHVKVSVGLGDVKAVAESGDQIVVLARIHSGDESDLEIVQAGGELHVRQRELNFRRPQPLDVTLFLPADRCPALSANVGRGDLSLERLSAGARANTGKGNIVVSAARGELQAQTGKGDIRVVQHQGAVHAVAGKGDIAVAGGSGALRIQTGFGDVSLADWQVPDEAECRVELGAGECRVQRLVGGRLVVQGGRSSCTLEEVALPALRVQTAKGDVRLSGDPGAGEWQVATATGDIALTLAAAASARVEAATRRGSIASDLPQVRVARPGPASRVGGGRSISITDDHPKAHVHLETVLGDIRIRQQGSARTQAPPPQAADRPPEAAGRRASQRTALEVLESLARREITVEEAEALLRTLEGAG
ncbi:MAG: DUF4097 family beta strand repeat-containing protein [Caldilineales bacterium]|nr:DUF4097 family beta strand repeat-containing protein [Caldilineales bacterium]MDW8316795.1 DUF4097 family beta strand repeat-containing protein [Anaerolineae bacterium]